MIRNELSGEGSTQQSQASNPNTTPGRTRSQIQSLNESNNQHETNSPSCTPSNKTAPSSNGNTGPDSLISQFQCDRCPCKYKRSSDLSKHLRLKHGIHPPSISEYLRKSRLNQMNSSNPNQVFTLDII